MCFRDALLAAQLGDESDSATEFIIVDHHADAAHGSVCANGRLLDCGT